jgi:ABC-type multidrug transport system fused ATPase/permease subunit
MIGYTYPLLDLFWSMFVFFGLFLWIWVLITIFVDIFRSQDLGGWGKAGWFLLVLVLPLFGALIYLIARGRSMHERAARQAEEQEVAFRQYVQEVATSDGSSTADELSKLAALADKGTITQQEFEEQKARLLGGQPGRPSKPTAA